MGKIQKYLAVFNLSVVHNLKNYKALIGLSFFMITCLLIFAHLWKVVATRSGAIVDLDPDRLLWYIAFNEWVIISLPDIQEDMEQDLRSGRLAYLLPRPLSYLMATFCEGLGSLCVNLLALGVVAFLFSWMMTSHLPFDFSSFLVMLLAGFCAGCIGLIFLMIIGISSFWFHEVGPFHWVWEKLLFILGGLMLPLVVYPEWMQAIAYLTPFPAILGERSALVIEFLPKNVLYIFGSLLCWGTIAVTFLIILYKKGLRIVNVEGG